MIQANELRIGNYVWGVSDRIETVHELMNEHLYTSFRAGLLNRCEYDDIQPIVLTQEMFPKLGFASNGFNWTIGLTINIQVTRLFGDDNFVYSFNGYEVKFLHQLQNIIHPISHINLNYIP